MKYTKGYRYQLKEDEAIQTNLYPVDNIFTPHISLFRSGFMYIKAGYAWDGPSGPTIDTDDSMTPSLFHDAAYELIRNQFLPQDYRLKADEWMFHMMMERRSNNWLLRKIQTIRDKVWLESLKDFAGWAASPKNKKKVYEVA